MPLSYRLSRAENPFDASSSAPCLTNMASPFEGGLFGASNNHTSHPDFAHLTLLVFEAVLEVVCVSLPGYIVARAGMFDADAQKFVAELNTILFTPCLIFTKLASQLTAEKLIELAIIPFIFVVQAVVSYLSSIGMAKVFRLKKKRERNFVIAMGVFGNSNSLPISLVISLSKTLKGLHWDKIPGDNDNEVGARGILYLLIFQQLGQVLRWSWGYNVLLAPAHKYTEEVEGSNSVAEEGAFEERRGLLSNSASSSESDISRRIDVPVSEGGLESGTATTTANTTRWSSSVSASSASSSATDLSEVDGQPKPNGITSFPSPSPLLSPEELRFTGPKGWWARAKYSTRKFFAAIGERIATACRKAFSFLPEPAQKVLAFIYHYTARFVHGVWSSMNPPLWAMVAAIIVASVPKLQHAFFAPGTFISNSLTRAVAQSGGVAVPLILVVLGANLARNTLPRDQRSNMEDPKLERNLVIASILARMLIPLVVMAPILAVVAKYVPVSILDDPIFVIVAFLITGAPTALQLAQICQMNNTYMGAMSRILSWSYVVLILPSTLILVMAALETVEWAAA